MKRFYFEIPGQNIFSCIYASTRKEAQHKIMQSSYAPFYREITWLTSDDDQLESKTNCSPFTSKVALIPTIAAAQYAYRNPQLGFDL